MIIVKNITRRAYCRRFSVKSLSASRTLTRVQLVVLGTDRLAENVMNIDSDKPVATRASNFIYASVSSEPETCSVEDLWRMNSSFVRAISQASLKG